ncbi:ribonuclease H-like domain-containing protein [Tanacetum coccineum]
MTMRTKPDVDTLSIDDLARTALISIKSGVLLVLQYFALLLPLQPILPEKEALAGFADEFYKKTEKEILVDGKTPVGFDKKKLEYFNCHNTGHFARECTAKGTHDGKKKRDSFYQHQEAGKQEKNQMGLLTMDDGIVNWGEHTKDEETNHALMAISSSSEANEIYEKDEKLKKYRRIGMKAVRKTRVPPEVYVSTPITTNEKGVSASKSKEVEPSCVSHIKTPRQPIKDQATPKVNRKNWNAMMERELGEGYSFTKKKCFVCGSLSHLIKDCDYYEKKMAKEAEVKKQRVCNTVQLNTGRPNINSVRTNINTGRTNINSVRPRVNTVNTNVNTVRSRQPVPTRTSNSFSPKRPQESSMKNMVDKAYLIVDAQGT